MDLEHRKRKAKLCLAALEELEAPSFTDLHAQVEQAALTSAASESDELLECLSRWTIKRA